jgi:hypothetical protein
VVLLLGSPAGYRARRFGFGMRAVPWAMPLAVEDWTTIWLSDPGPAPTARGSGRYWVGLPWTWLWDSAQSLFKIRDEASECATAGFCSDAPYCGLGALLTQKGRGGTLESLGGVAPEARTTRRIMLVSRTRSNHLASVDHFSLSHSHCWIRIVSFRVKSISIYTVSDVLARRRVYLAARE